MAAYSSVLAWIIPGTGEPGGLPSMGSHRVSSSNSKHLLYPFICQWIFKMLNILAIVNSAAMNIGLQVSFLIRVFIFFRYMPRSGIAGSYGNSIFRV